MNIQPGDLLFYKVTPRSGWMSKLIAVVQMVRGEGSSGTSYSHVALSDFNSNYQLESTPPKTRRGLVDWANPSIEVWRIKNVSAAQVSNALGWAYTHLNKPYDFSQILLGWITWSNGYTCAEFVKSAYDSTGVSLSPTAGRFVGPNELMNLDLLEKIS